MTKDQTKLIFAVLEKLHNAESKHDEVTVLRAFAQAVVDEVISHGPDERKRDLYRAAALQGLLANPETNLQHEHSMDVVIPELAKRIAEKMLDIDLKGGDKKDDES